MLKTNCGSVYRCLLCQCPESVLIQTGARHAPEVEVRRCTDCGLVFLWPRPTGEELRRYYAIGEVYHEEDGDPSVAKRYITEMDEARVRVRRLLPLLKPDTRLLEVGSGSGAFLDAVRPYVSDLMGVEPNAPSRDLIRQQIRIPVVERVDDVLKEAKSFDLVALFHVLEHVPEPVRFLQDVARLLRSDGRLVVEVPNVDDTLVAVYQIPAYLRFYYQKAHLYYFSTDTLMLVFNQAGFDATIEGIQRYNLSNHIRWMLTGKPGGQGYYNDILLPSVHTAYADALIRAGHSDTLWAIAQVSREAR